MFGLDGIMRKRTLHCPLGVLNLTM